MQGTGPVECDCGSAVINKRSIKHGVRKARRKAGKVFTSAYAGLGSVDEDVFIFGIHG